VTFLAHRERFARIGSTNDAVRARLAAGTPEVCLAVADEQTAGRGRAGRAWLAPRGAALLLSVGFRPAWLAPAHAWRLAAVVSLAMADAAEDHAGLRDRTIRLKWPNDLVVEGAPHGAENGAGADGGVHAGADAAGASAGGGPPRKLGGVLGEADGLGTADPRVVVGIGVNAGWARPDFPPDLAPAMTSLREASGGRPIDRDRLLDGFLARLEARVEALHAGRFPVDDWAARQVVTGRLVRLEGHGRAPEEVLALGVDPVSGALLVADPAAPGRERAVHAGDVVHVRLAGGPAGAPAGGVADAPAGGRAPADAPPVSGAPAATADAGRTATPSGAV
jgi:BirA family transcriptional regulator, biotin operon repressor / biotin---[acetyl-CoA-carboxylase] ligase